MTTTTAKTEYVRQSSGLAEITTLHHTILTMQIVATGIKLHTTRVKILVIVSITLTKNNAIPIFIYPIVAKLEA